jgi:membrane protease YdiL (CAAX protease family)
LGAYGAVALLSAAGWIFGAGRTKSYAANVLIIALTCFVAHFLVTGFTQKKIGRTNAAVAVEAGEMQMRLVACFDSVRRHGFKADKAASEAKRGETESKQRKEAFDLNEKSLNEAVATNPRNPEFPAKLIILLGANRTPEHIQRIKELDKQLADMKGTVHDTTHLAVVLKSLYETQDSIVSDVQLRDYRGVLTKQIPQGWYQDQAIERLLELQPDKQQLQTFRDEVDTRNITMFVKFCFLVVLIVLAGLIGIINAFIQIGMTAAKPAKQLDEVELPVPLKSVYAVFVTWFSIQILVSTAGHLILAKHPEISQQPNTVALLTMLTYLISNLPGPLLIYFIALKPKGVQPGDFFRELRIRFRTSTASPPKILFMGWLAWCTAIPIVLACAYAASKIFHTQSSDNPVISQIIQIANATDPLAVIIFYFTLGVMAPFFEEILFRGFMFAALKPRIGSLLAMLLSAATFAVMHFDKGGALMLFAIGFIFAFTFNRTRSLVPSMIAHGLWNAGTFTLVLTLFGT